MRKRSSYALGLILLAALAPIAAGCGGGKAKSAASTPATTAPATTAPATTATADTTPTTTTSAAASDLSGIASAANCKELADLGTKFSTAMTGTAAQDTKKIAQLLEEFAAKTPSDIRPDFKVVADAYSKIADAVGNLKPGSVPDAAALAKLQKMSGEIDSAKLTQASEHISAWVQKSCRP